MPKTSIHKYYASMLWQDNIRLAREVSSMNPEPKPKSMKVRANDQFGLGVL
jgi:hypothetical protein